MCLFFSLIWLARIDCTPCQTGGFPIILAKTLLPSQGQCATIVWKRNKNIKIKINKKKIKNSKEIEYWPCVKMMKCVWSKVEMVQHKIIFFAYFVACVCFKSIQKIFIASSLIVFIPTIQINLISQQIRYYN